MDFELRPPATATAAGRPPGPAPARPAAQMVTVHVAEGVAQVTLSRPRMHNALVPELLLELCVVLESLGRREDVRCVLLRAGGEAFSIGTDLRRFAREMTGPALQGYAAELVGLLNQAILTLLRLPQPVVVAVRGAVCEGALGLVLAADVAIAADDVRFRSQASTPGLSPDGGWTALLPRLVGARRASQALLLDTPVDASQALDWGLIGEAVPPAELDVRARVLAQRLAAAPVVTMQRGKRLLWGDLQPIEDALERERLGFIETVGSLDAREGIARFLSTAPDYPSDDA